MICKECGASFDSHQSLHKHLKKHSLSVEDYYYKHYPRKDLYDGSFIEFRDIDTYFESYFNNRDNMVMYFKKYPDRSAPIAREMIQKRVIKKELKKPLCQVELRSCLLPSVLLLEKVGIDYNNLTNFKGFDYKQNLEFIERDSDFKILQDTREQEPLPFYNKHVTKLECGDYTVGGKYYKGIYAERKSLSDLISTISQGYDRFTQEIQRADDFDFYMVVCVERPLFDVLHFNKLYETKRVKATPEFIFHRIRDLIQKFNNIQFLFVKDRDEMKQKIGKMFLMENDIRKVDLQYCYDKGSL